MAHPANKVTFDPIWLELHSSAILTLYCLQAPFFSNRFFWNCSFGDYYFYCGLVVDIKDLENDKMLLRMCIQIY